MKIKIIEHEGPFRQIGWHIKENDSGFWCYLGSDSQVPFKFPWKLYTYKIMEEV